MKWVGFMLPPCTPPMALSSIDLSMIVSAAYPCQPCALKGNMVACLPVSAKQCSFQKSSS